MRLFIAEPRRPDLVHMQRLDRSDLGDASLPTIENVTFRAMRQPRGSSQILWLVHSLDGAVTVGILFSARIHDGVLHLLAVTDGHLVVPFVDHPARAVFDAFHEPHPVEESIALPENASALSASLDTLLVSRINPSLTSPFVLDKDGLAQAVTYACRSGVDPTLFFTTMKLVLCAHRSGSGAARIRLRTGCEGVSPAIVFHDGVTREGLAILDALVERHHPLVDRLVRREGTPRHSLRLADYERQPWHPDISGTTKPVSALELARALSLLNDVALAGP